MRSHSEKVEGEMQSLQIKKKTGKKNRSRIDAILHDESAGCSSSGSETESQEEQKEHKVASSKNRPRSGKGSGSSASRSNVTRSILAHRRPSLADDLHSEEVRARSGSAGEIEYSSRGISPWVQRRIQAATRESKSAGSSMNDLSVGDTVSTSKMSDVISVLRQPRGPDGTRGFNLLR